MAVPATGPVAENVYSVTVECSMKFTLDTGSICYVLSVSLPLVVIRGMNIACLSIMTLETHRYPGIGEGSVRISLTLDI